MGDECVEFVGEKGGVLIIKECNGKIEDEWEDGC